MAHETRGLLYEAITEAALKQAKKITRVAGEVYWNQKPKGMSVTPDLTIGRSIDKPSHVILVTASGAARNSEMKSWRNLGEMQEVKAQLPGPPIVINIYFKSEVKQGLSAASEHLYDGILHVEQKSYYKPLQEWVNDNLRSAAKNKDARRKLLEDSIKTDRRLASALAGLAKDLSLALKQRKNDLDPLWKLMQIDYATPRKYPTARVTYVRRGLGKLSVLEPRVRQLIYDHHSKRTSIPTAKLPQYVFGLGFLHRTIGGARLADPEITEVINLLGSDTCETLLKRAPAAMQPWIDELQQLENVPLYLDFVASEFDSIVDSRKLFALLTECQYDPQAFATKHKIPFRGRLSRNWLFLTLMDIVKASTGRLTGFGYAELAVEVGASKDLSSGYITIADWANCVPDVLLPKIVLRGVAEVLATRVREISQIGLKKLGQRLIEVTKKSVLEDRLIPYRMFEALLWLLEAESRKQGKAFTGKAPYGGWLNQYANVGRASATTPFVRFGKTLVHWKSASDAGKDHKRKELAARARNVKYEYDATTRTFKRRADVERLALIVDGTFTDADLKVLADAGWDIIVYPDQIADLVSKL
jgi:hypothetical protein